LHRSLTGLLKSIENSEGKLEGYLALRDYFKIGLVLLIFSTSILIGVGQDGGEPKQDSKPPASSTEQTNRSSEKVPFELSIKTRPILNLSLKAEKVRLADIGAELSKRLKTQVFVGQSLQKEIVSIEFSSLTLEPAMQLLAPAAYIDYEIDTSAGVAPKPLAIFLYDANSGEPPLTAVIPGTTQSLLVEGDTEDGVEPETDEAKKKLEEQPLRIQFQNNILSVQAKKQPLVLVLLKIGEELGIPVDIQYEPQDIIDTEISKVPVEDAVRKLSPNIRLFLRADLLHAERRALRLVLADPAKTAQQGM